MRLREAIDWPPVGCVGGYSGAERLPFDPDIATIGEVMGRTDSIRIEVVQGGRSWSCAILLPRGSPSEAVLETLERSHGMTLTEVGDQELAEL